MRNRAFRRHQTDSHLRRRLSEDRNQHFDDLACSCWTDARAIARFKEQPARCSGRWCCGNPRRWWGQRTIQERRVDQSDH